MSEWIGRTLSKVEIQRLLGRGGMADVYLGLHTTLNRPVAVKILHSHFTDDKSLMARFRAEAQAVATMRHPNIVQVLDFDISDDRPYIVMELLDGISLREYLTDVRNTGRALEPQTVGFLISSVGSALDYAHSRGIVHRDVKPANVMLRHEGTIEAAPTLPDKVEVVLTDFGVARMADTGADTASGVMIGTPAYMSPEQVRGEKVDARTDIYALGIMLYEMLSGALPFDGDSQASILIKQISEPPPSIPAIPKEVQAVIDRALAKDPAKRFQTASDLAAAAMTELGLMDQNTDVRTMPFVPRPVTSEGITTKQLEVSGPATSQDVAQHANATLAGQPQKAALPSLPVLIGIAALVLAIGAVGLLAGRAFFGGDTNNPTEGAATAAVGDLPTQANSSIENAQPVGHVLINTDVVAVTLDNLQPPPDGMIYEAWLTDPEAEPFSLGKVQMVEDALVFAFAEANTRDVLSRYSEFALTIEPLADDDPAMSGDLAYAGSIPAEQLAMLRLMLSTQPTRSLKEAVMQGVQEQADTYDAHLDNMVNSINANNMPDAITHAEHMINIVVGRNSPEFADYNGNARPENPGDGVGLAVYLTLLQETALGAAAEPTAGADLLELAGAMRGSVDEILLLLTSGKDRAVSMTAADSIDEMEALAADLQALHVHDAIGALLGQAEDVNLSVQIEVYAVD